MPQFKEKLDALLKEARANIVENLNANTAEYKTFHDELTGRKKVKETKQVKDLTEFLRTNPFGCKNGAARELASILVDGYDIPSSYALAECDTKLFAINHSGSIYVVENIRKTDGYSNLWDNGHNGLLPNKVPPATPKEIQERVDNYSIDKMLRLLEHFE